MKLRATLFITSLILSFSLQSISAQSIDYRNKVEFSDNEINDDLNSINVISNINRPVVKKVEEKAETSITDLAAILDNKRLYYRNIRRPVEKCYRDTEESCAK